MKQQVPVALHPEAIDEASAARRWYAERSLLAAEAFEPELDRAILAIGEAPSRWVGHVASTRRFVLQRFPFSVVHFELVRQRARPCRRARSSTPGILADSAAVA